MSETITIAVTEGPKKEEILEALSAAGSVCFKGYILSDPLNDATEDEWVVIIATIKGMTSPHDSNQHIVSVDITCTLPDGRTFNGAGPYSLERKDIGGHTLRHCVIGKLMSDKLIDYGPI